MGRVAGSGPGGVWTLPQGHWRAEEGPVWSLVEKDYSGQVGERSGEGRSSGSCLTHLGSSILCLKDLRLGSTGGH